MKLKVLNETLQSYYSIIKIDPLIPVKTTIGGRNVKRLLYTHSSIIIKIVLNMAPEKRSLPPTPLPSPSGSVENL